jgi:hypothetical protein
MADAHGGCARRMRTADAHGGCACGMRMRDAHDTDPRERCAHARVLE